MFLPLAFLQTDLPNIYHAFQTAERIREKHPDEDWIHLIGLIHDMGKIMAMHGQPQVHVRWEQEFDTIRVSITQFYDQQLLYTGSKLWTYVLPLKDCSP